MPLAADTGVAIVGAGFGGLGMAIRLKQAGRDDFVVLERAEDVGGTWSANSYPGCQCDIPPSLDSFSFARNPDWTTAYPMRDQIHEYLRDCVLGRPERCRSGSRAACGTAAAAAGTWTRTVATRSDGPASATSTAAAPIVGEVEAPSLSPRAPVREAVPALA